MSFQDATPLNISELVTQARDKSNYDQRLRVVEELGKWRCQQSKDVLRCLMLHDKVYAVQEAAFRRLQAFGEAVKLPRKKKGHLIDDINKKLVRVRESLGDMNDLEEFKRKFREMYPEAFDVYRFEKGTKMDEWILNVLASAPKKKA